MDGASGSKIVERIDAILKQQNLNRNDMCKVLGKNSNVISSWKTRNTIPQADIAVKIADYLGVSIRWLVTGEEDRKMDRETEEMLRDWAQLSENQRHMMGVQMHALAGEKTEGQAVV